MKILPSLEWSKKQMDGRTSRVSTSQVMCFHGSAGWSGHREILLFSRRDTSHPLKHQPKRFWPKRNGKKLNQLDPLRSLRPCRWCLWPEPPPQLISLCFATQMQLGDRIWWRQEWDGSLQTDITRKSPEPLPLNSM